MERQNSFIARGGWWVVMQVPLLCAAVVLPVWSNREIPLFTQPTQLLGWTIVCVAVSLFCASLAALGRGLSPFPRPRRDSMLVTHGIYRFMRHPIYTSMVLAALGWSVVLLSSIGGAFALVLALFFDRKARAEERWLRQRFPGYADYARRVRRFIPSIY